MPHTLKILCSVQSPVFRMSLSSVGMMTESLVLASPKHLMRLLGASGVFISFFSWGVSGICFVGYSAPWVFFLKLANHNTIVRTRGSWGNQRPTLVIYPSVYPSIHPSISPSIHPPIQVPTQCRALCWVLRHRLKKLAWFLIAECPCSVRSGGQTEHDWLWSQLHPGAAHGMCWFPCEPKSPDRVVFRFPPLLNFSTATPGPSHHLLLLSGCFFTSALSLLSPFSTQQQEWPH